MKLNLPQRLAFALRSVFRQRMRSAGTLAAISMGVAVIAFLIGLLAKALLGVNV